MMEHPDRMDRMNSVPGNTITTDITIDSGGRISTIGVDSNRL